MDEKRINDKVIIRKAKVFDIKDAARIKRELSTSAPLSDVTVRAVEEFLHDYLRAYHLKEISDEHTDAMYEECKSIDIPDKEEI